MKTLKNFTAAVLAGFMISIGGTVFLACESKVVGATFFSLGLTVILMQGYLLFTGKTAYVFDNKPSYLLDLLLIWVGNIVGTAIVGALVHYAKPALAETASALCEAKLAQTPLQTIVLGALCGVLVYIAVDYYKTNTDKSPLPKLLLVFTCIPVFILCGFEHSVADMFYFAASADFALYTVEGFVYILYVSLGNLIGAVVFHVVRRFAQSAAAKK